MFINNIKIAFRNLLKFKGYAALNIIGLSIGIASCLLIVQYIQDERSYDQYHANGENLYRVHTEFIGTEGSNISAGTPSPLAFTAIEEIPEVENAARITGLPGIEKSLLTYEEQAIFETDLFLADSTFFRLFTYQFLQGDPEHALDEPNAVVLSQTTATKLFGQTNPLGEIISISNGFGDYTYKVTGVFDDEFSKSHIQASVFMSMRSEGFGAAFYRTNQWAGNNFFLTYLQLRPGTNPEVVEQKFEAVTEKYAAEQLQAAGFDKSHHLAKMTDIYLHHSMNFNAGSTGNATLLFILGSIAAFVFLLACMNFMNLTTAKATIRAQEIGVRKVIGATRSTLFNQFLTEAFLYAALAITTAYTIARLTLPFFNKLTDKELDVNLLGGSSVLLWITGLLVLTTLIAGSYPALYLSSFRPIQALTGKIGSRFSAENIRKGLVVFQFIVSILLIQGVVIINQQMQFIQEKNLGFNETEKIILPLNTEETKANYPALRNELLQIPQVKKVGATSIYPGKFIVNDAMMYGEAQTVEEAHSTSMVFTEPNYLKMMDFELLKGRFFEQEHFSADTMTTAIINETSMQLLGYEADDVLGKTIEWDWGENHITYQIIGVVEDFHFESLHNPIEPLVFLWQPGREDAYLVLSAEMGDTPNLLASIETTWNKLNPNEPVNYLFLNEQLQQNYLSDQRMADIVLGFTLLAVLVSCLGLLGLAAFAAARRKKEIGIRKVLGATADNIVALLSKDFMKLVFFAIILATPLAWYAATRWLENFAYSVPLQWWMFTLAGIFALLVALLTVSVQSVRAALANPVESIRTE